jgi:muconate cycloisomerase
MAGENQARLCLQRTLSAKPRAERPCAAKPRAERPRAENRLQQAACGKTRRPKQEREEELVKITGVQLDPIHTPRRTGDITQHMIITLHTDEGFTGYGEMADLADLPVTMPDVEDFRLSLENILVGLNPQQYVHIDFVLGLLNMDRSLQAGIEMAVLDLVGKINNQPLSHYLGGPTRTRIKVCYPLFRTYSSAAIEANLETVQHFLDRGFDVFRCYLGDVSRNDEDFLSELSREFGDRIHMQSFDYSGHLHPSEAYRSITRCRKYFEPDYVESVGAGRDDLRGMADVRRRLDILVSEHVRDAEDALRMYQAGAVDIVTVANASSGGILRALKMFATAEMLGLQCILSTTQETSLGTAAVAHSGAAVFNVHYPTVAIGPLIYTKDVAANPIQYEDGYMIVPTGPGLGIEIDPEKLADCRAPLSWSMYEFARDVKDVHDKPAKADLTSGIGLQAKRKK